MMSVRMQPLQSTAISVTAPAGVIWPILGGALVKLVPSVNHRLPSEPLVMACGSLLAVGTLNCLSVPTGAASAVVASDNATPVATAAVRTRPALRDIRRPLIDDVVSTIRTSQIGWSGWMRARQCPVLHHPTLVDSRWNRRLPLQPIEFDWTVTTIAPFASDVTTQQI